MTTCHDIPSVGAGTDPKDTRLAHAVQALLQRSRVLKNGDPASDESLDVVGARLAAEVRSRDFARSRTYKTTPLAVDCFTPGCLADSLRQFIGDLIHLHFQIQRRRWEAGKRLEEIDRLCLISALRGLRRIWRDLRYQWDGPLEKMIDNVVQRSAISNNGALSVLRLSVKVAVLDFYCRAKLLAFHWGLHVATKNESAPVAVRRIAERLQRAAPGRKSQIDLLLFDMIFGARRIRETATRVIAESFMDRSTGLISQMPTETKGRRLWYTRPLLLLAMISLARREKLRTAPRPSVQMEALAEGKNPQGNDTDAVEFLSAWDLGNKTPPQLPCAWGPGPPTFQSQEADQTVAAILKSSFRALKNIGVVPEKAAFILSVRHDVDRPLLSTELDTIRKFENACGIKSTWFFKPETYDFAMATVLLQQDCEVGYHCSDARNGDGGFAQRLLAELGPSVTGVSFHGGFGSFYWEGISTLQQLAELGFSYAEWPSDIFMHPRPWPWEQPRLYLTPPGIKIQSRPEFFQKHLDFTVKHRGHVIIENHPDLFDQSVRDTISRLLDAGGAPRYIAQHVEVCRLADREAFFGG
jgi:hypothetical protein